MNAEKGTAHLPSADGSGLAGVTELAGYRDVLEVLRSPKFATEHTDGQGEFRGGSLLRINGPEHTRRRRAMNHLTGHDHHKWFRETALYPTLKANLRDVLASADETGAARTDLVEFGARTNVQLAAAMIGLRTLDRTERLNELMGLIDAFRPIPGIRWVIDPNRRAEITRRAVEALAVFEERFFRPSLADHQLLMERYSAGALTKDELPRDFLTLVAAHSDFTLVEALGARVDPELAKPEIAVREAAATLIIGSVDTTTFSITWCLEDLTAWFAGHPEDYAQRTDELFLRGAVWESTRLHAPFPAFSREATEDVQLGNGVLVRAGEIVALRFGMASRDPSVFGLDANIFNPRREVPRGVLPYGLAFGSGPHMCYGLPIVLGNDGTDGSLVHFIRQLYEAGVRRDPTRPPELATGTHSERFALYPVVFAPTAPTQSGSTPP